MMSETEKNNLSSCVEEFGLIDKPIINADDTIIGGHQRLSILEEKGIDVIDCWVPDRLLTDLEVETLNIKLNKSTASWDYDIMANMFDVGFLLNCGFTEEELGMGKDEKPKKEPKPVISIEFSDKDTMMEYIAKCETIAIEASAKIKIRG